MRGRPGGVVYDFEDFLSVVGNSNSRKVEMVELTNAVIRDWKNGHSSVKGKKIVQLRRSSRSLFVKMSHEEEDFTELDFLLNKFPLTIPITLRPQDRGIEEDKKRDIINKLVPLMPPTRRLFCNSLPTSSTDEE